MHKIQTFLFWRQCSSLLEQKYEFAWFCENALELCAPPKFVWADVKAGTCKLFCLGNKIFLCEEKRTCFQLKIGLSTEAASFLLLGVFCFVVCFKRYVKTCRKRFNGFLKRRFGKMSLSAHGCFGRPKSLIWVFAKTELTC